MTSTRSQTLVNLAEIRDRVARSATKAGRDAAEVTIVAAAKMVPADVVRWVVEEGLTDVGENYVKELSEKRRVLGGVRWHYIGALQTNTAHRVAAEADVVQTLASARATERLSRRAAEHGRRLDSLIEVDFTRQRTGLVPEDVPAFADRVATLEGLELIGLMTLPPIPQHPEDARPFFIALRELRDRIRERHPGVLELSMGMSLDYGVAVEEGATIVRIGTALFGQRPRE